MLPKRDLAIPALPNAAFPNRELPKTEVPESVLLAAKFDSARDDEIAEFIPLEEVMPKDRVPEEKSLEAMAPRAVDAPPNECQLVDIIEELRALAPTPELNPRPAPLAAPGERPNECHWRSAMTGPLLALDAPNRAFEFGAPKPRPFIPPAP